MYFHFTFHHHTFMIVNTIDNCGSKYILENNCLMLVVTHLLRRRLFCVGIHGEVTTIGFVLMSQNHCCRL